MPVVSEEEAAKVKAKKDQKDQKDEKKNKKGAFAQTILVCTCYHLNTSACLVWPHRRPGQCSLCVVDTELSDTSCLPFIHTHLNPNSQTLIMPYPTQPQPQTNKQTNKQTTGVALEAAELKLEEDQSALKQHQSLLTVFEQLHTVKGNVKAATVASKKAKQKLAEVQAEHGPDAVQQYEAKVATFDAQIAKLSEGVEAAFDAESEMQNTVAQAERNVAKSQEAINRASTAGMSGATKKSMQRKHDQLTKQKDMVITAFKRVETKKNQAVAALEAVEHEKEQFGVDTNITSIFEAQMAAADTTEQLNELKVKIGLLNSQRDRLVHLESLDVDMDEANEEVQRAEVSKSSTHIAPLFQNVANNRLESRIKRTLISYMIYFSGQTRRDQGHDDRSCKDEESCNVCRGTGGSGTRGCLHRKRVQHQRREQSGA